MATSLILDASSPYPWIAKGLTGILDYTFNWADWLGVDTIATATWTVPTGLTKASQSNTTTTATAWLSGGKVGATYQVTCSITTAGGRTDARTIEIRVAKR